MAEITLPTQQFVEIKEIKDGVIYLKNGGLRKILMVGGVNFDLKSEEEQELILNSFQNFLNALDFSIQFFIHSRKINIDNYVKKIEALKEEETNELLKVQIDDYIAFIKSFVEQNDIFDKTFFVVVPFDATPINVSSTDIFGWFKKTSKSTAPDQESDEQKNIQQLNQRIDQIINGLQQIGLRTMPLEDETLIELFYNLYNPQLVEKKDLVIPKNEN